MFLERPLGEYAPLGVRPNKAMDCSDCIARLENSHGRAAKPTNPTGIFSQEIVKGH